MRRLKEVDDGGRVEYTYNAAGSLTEIHVIDRNGTIGGQRLTLDEDQEVTGIERLAGGETHLTYDRLGNVTAVTVGDQTTRYTYDRLNRLMDIVTLDGKRLRYDYRDGEPDLRLQMDHHTGRVVSERVTSGQTFSWGLELLSNRTEGNGWGVVRFDRAMLDYRLASDLGVVLPDRVQEQTLARIRVMEVGPSGDKEKQAFDAPSNVMFIPAEYWAVNCCPECPYGDDVCHFLCDLDGGGGGGIDYSCFKNCGKTEVIRIFHRNCAAGTNMCHVTLCSESFCYDDNFNDACIQGEPYGAHFCAFIVD
jgi:YD repeat-containing protein